LSSSHRARGLSGRAVAGLAIATACATACATGCASSGGSPGTRDAAARTTTVTIELTPAGCAPKPARIPAGPVQFTVANQDADAVSEAELRTSDLTKILGEQENLTPGLSGGFSLDL
jgi:iron uptake system component EfeO